MEQNSNSKLKDRLYKYFPSKKPGAQSVPTLISSTVSNKGFSNSVLVPKIKMEPLPKKTLPLTRDFSETNSKLTNNHIKKKEALKQIQLNQLSNQGKAIVQLRKTMVNQGILKDEKYVTPVVVFQFFKNFPYMCQDFFYLNKGSHPYQYHVVQFKQKNPNEYMTISCKGVTQFICKQTNFMTQQQWLKQQRMYNSLQKIDFFKNYKLNKNFRIWRNLMKRHHLQQISNVLNQKLFLTINPSRKAILAIRNQCLIFEQRCKMFVPDMRDTYQIQNFEHQIKQFQKTTFLDTIRAHEERVAQILEEHIQQWISEYKKQNNIQSKNQKNYKYSRKALLRMQYIKIAHLIKLVQAILRDSKINMVIHNIQNLLEHLQNIGDQQRQESIICRVDWQDEQFKWSPSRTKFKNVFVDLINHAVKILSDDARSLDQLPIFVEYNMQEQNSVQLKKQQRRPLFTICSDDEKYKQITGNIISELQKTFDNFLKQQQSLTQYVEIYGRHENINKLKEQIQSITAAELRRIIRQFKVQRTKMQNMDHKVQKGLIVLSYSKLRDRIVNAPTESLNIVLTELPQLMMKKAQRLQERTLQYSNLISQYPTNVEVFVQSMQSVNKTSGYLEQLSSQGHELIQLVGLMEQQKIPYLDRYKSKSKQAFQGVQTLKSKIDQFYVNYDQNLSTFKKDLQASAVKVDLLVDELISKLQNVPLHKKDDSIDEIIEFIVENKKLAQQVNNQATDINRLQTSLNLPPTGFAKVQAFYFQFDLMSKLWLGRKKWYQTINAIKQQHFQDVDIQQLSQQYDSTIKLTEQLIQLLAQQSQVAKIFQEEVKNFESVIKTLKALRDPNLREDQQWIEIPEFIYRKSHPQVKQQILTGQLPLGDRTKPIYTVNWFVHHGIHQWYSELDYFGIKSAKEKQLSEILSQCKKFLIQSQISFVQYNESKDIYKLSNQNKPIFAAIDQKIITLYNVMANKYSKNLHSKVELLIKQYHYLQQLFQEMLVHQQSWALLEPILSSANSKILVKQLKDFGVCDTQWKRVTKNLRQNSYCLKIANDYVNKQHLKAIMKSNAILQQIHKSLDDFLDKKRNSLPRLYFISNQQMLNLMSEAHNVKQVSPFLHKFFTAVKQLQFDKQTPIGIISFDDEIIGIKQFGARMQGQIEELMKMIQDQIKKSLSSIFKTVLPKYDDQQISIQNLVVDYPSQVANTVEWITWTKIGQNYLSPDPIGELYNWYQIQETQLQQLISLLKRKQLSHRHKAIRSLFVQSLYLKETTYSMMLKGVSSVNDYNWLKIIKFHHNHTNPQIFMTQFNSKLAYGFEFQLIGSPFVITPNCERQILNLSQTISQKTLSVLVGKSCTGKTETLKGLSQLLGHNLVMCNCDNDSSVKVIQRLILAACSTGSWIIFEKFDALELSTMSALASMISIVFKNLSASNQNLVLNKSNVFLSPNTSIFLSCTNNTPFKTQIFKKQLRIISFVPIQQQQLYRIILDSYTFTESTKLISLFMQVIKKINEQTQNVSYQLNLRDCKQIIMALAVLNKNAFKKQQDMLAYILNKMLPPRVYKKSQKLQQLLNEICQKQEQKDLQKQQTFNKLLEIKSSVIVYGQSLSGKSSFIKQANKISKSQLNFVVVNALQQWQIVGSHDNRIKGLLYNIPRESWIVFDGPLKSIQPIYSQMQSDYVSLEKGQTIINKNWKVIFETQCLSTLPPSLLGKVGLLNLDKSLTFDQIIQKQLLKISNTLLTPNLIQLFENQLSNSFKKIISFRKNYNLLILNNDHNLLIACCQNLINICNKLEYPFKQNDPKDTRKIIQRIVTWCVSWGIGRLVVDQSLSRFQKIISQIIKPENQPPNSIFNYYLSLSTCEWKNWQTMYSATPTIIQQNDSIYVPSIESNYFKYFISGFVQNNQAFMVLGEPGIGRSAVVKNCLRQLKNQLNLYNLPIIVSEYHKSNYLQKLIENDMQQQKLNDKHFLVPVAGKKFIVQIQQLNLGTANDSSLEMMRSIISHKGVFDRKTLNWKQIKELTMASMGRLKTNEQFNQRLANLLNISIKRNSRESMSTIFTSMVQIWLDQFHVNTALEARNLVKVTLDIMEYVLTYQKKQNCPWQVSYKDVNKLFSMMMEVKIFSQGQSDDTIKLWAYQMMRTFGDRLHSNEQKQKLSDLIKKKSFIDLKYSLNQNIIQPEIFYTSRIININYQKSSLQEIENEIQKKLQSNEKARVLMFRQIIDHITRMSRGIDMQNGHFMMIGNRGVGKASIAKFTCYLLGIGLETADCLKNQQSFLTTLINAASGQHTCILLNEVDLLDAKNIFIIKNIMCNNIQYINLSKQQQENIIENVLKQQVGQYNWKIQQLIKAFYEKAYKCLHLIFCLPPTHQTKQFLRKQSLLVRNCSIDYVEEWPQPTFVQLTQMNLFEPFTTQQKEKISRLNYKFYVAAIEQSKGTSIVISPKQYLQTISLFNTKYAILRQQIQFSSTKINRSLKYVSDIKSVIEMEESTIKFLQQQMFNIMKYKQQLRSKINAKQNKLQEFNFDTEDPSYIAVKKQFSIINEKKTKHISNFKKSNELLNSISSRDILLLKSTGQTKETVGVLRLAGILFKQNQSWESLNLAFLRNTSILSKLKIFEIAEIDVETLTELADHMNSIETITDNLTNTTLNILVKWFVNFMQIVNLYLSLCGQQKQLFKEEDPASDYSTIQQQLFNLQTMNDNCNYYKDLLDYDMKKSQKKIKTCETILNNISTQIDLWRDLTLRNDEKLRLLTNNLFFACNSFKYISLFDNQKRSILMNKWQNILKQENIQYSSNYIQVLFDPFEVELIKNYTEENFLNCIVMLKAPGVPYLLDANRLLYPFLKQNYHNIRIIKYNEQNYEKNLQLAIQNGIPILLEYSQKTLDAPLLNIINALSQQNRTIKINEKQVDFSSNFKLFILNPKTDAYLSQEVYIECPVINFDLNKEHIYQQLLRQFQQIVEPEQKYIHLQSINDLMANKVRVQKKEDLLMSMIQSLNIDAHNITEIIQDYTNAQSQKKQIQDQINKLKTNIFQQSQKLNKHKDLMKQSSDLAEVVLSEFKPLFNFKKFRQVFVKVLDHFNENTFVEELTSQIFMRVLNSREKNLSQKIKLMFKLYSQSKNTQQFKSLWSIIKLQNKEQTLNKLVQKGILSNNIQDKVKTSQYQQDGSIIDQLQLNDVQKALVSYLIKQPIDYPTKLSQYEYIVRGISQLHPILIVNSLNVNQTILRLAQQYQISQNETLSIYAGQLLKNQERIKDYKWFIVQNCDKYPDILELAEKHKREDARFFLIYKEQSNVQTNIYSITRIHLSLKQNVTNLIDQKNTSSILNRFSFNKTSVVIAYRIIEAFNTKKDSDEYCSCSLESPYDVQRIIKGVVQTNELNHLTVSQIIQSIIALCICTSDVHKQFLQHQLSSIPQQQFLSFQMVLDRLPENIISKWTP